MVMKTPAVYIAILTLLIGLSSCGDDFLTLTPTDVLTDRNFFQNESQAQSALIGVYGTLQDQYAFRNVRNAAAIEWCMSGGVYDMDQSANRVELHTLNLPPSNSIVTGIYEAAYRGIRQANIVIGRVSKMKSIEDQKKSLIIAQAKFIRGIYYYRLVTYYGGVPLILEELNSSSDLAIPRSSAEDIWKQIENDLKEAASVLPTKWEKSSDIGRATKGAALGFLVRAYLWQHKWNEAVKSSEAIINSGIYELLPDFRDVFRETNENNKEIVFSTQFIGGHSGEGNSLPIRSAPRGAPSKYVGSASWSNFVPTKHWVDRFERDQNGTIIDQRYWTVIIGPGEHHQDMPGFIMPENVPSGWSKTGYIVTKYWQKPTVSSSGVNPPVLRYAEVLLNYAEALNETGRSQEAMVEVNKIRKRAGLYLKPLTLSKEKVLESIFYEARMGFIWEPYGGFSMLNRRGKFLSFIKKWLSASNYKSLQVDKKPWLQTKPILLPIPQSALDRNKELVQSPGYPN